MWHLGQITILGFPLFSFATLVAVFWVLGFCLSRGGAGWKAASRAARSLVRLAPPHKRGPGAATADRKMAA